MKRYQADAGAPAPNDTAEADDALRYVVRAEVAGAAPPADAWLRLQQRLAEDSRRREQVALRIEARPGWPGSQFGTLARLRRPYLAQVSAALLLLLAMLGTLLPTARLPGWVGQPAVVPPNMVNLPSRVSVRPNRGILLSEGTGDDLDVALDPLTDDGQAPPTLTYTGHGPDGLPMPPPQPAGVADPPIVHIQVIGSPTVHRIQFGDQGPQ